GAHRVHRVEDCRVHHGHVTGLAVVNSVGRHGVDGDRVPIGDDVRIGNLWHTQKCGRTRDQNQKELLHVYTPSTVRKENPSFAALYRPRFSLTLNMARRGSM